MNHGGLLRGHKAWRTPGYDWFPEESITTGDLDRLPDIHVDIVISHTCPAEFEIMDEVALARDSCQQALAECQTFRLSRSHGKSHGAVLGAFFEARILVVSS